MKSTARSTLGRYLSPALRSARAASAVFATSFPFDSRETPWRAFEGSPPSCPHPPSGPCTEASHLAPFSTATMVAGSGATEVFAELGAGCARADFSPLPALLLAFWAQMTAQ